MAVHVFLKVPSSPAEEVIDPQVGRQNLAAQHSMPVVAMSWNAERFQGRNLALRLVTLGFPTSTGIAGAARHGKSPVCRRLDLCSRIGRAREAHTTSRPRAPLGSY